MHSWSPCSETSDALLLGGVGGIDDLIVVNARTSPTAAGTNHTMLSRGTSLGWRTNNGVIPWPRTIPIGWDNPITAVARGP